MLITLRIMGPWIRQYLVGLPDAMIGAEHISQVQLLYMSHLPAIAMSLAIIAKRTLY